MKDAGIGLIVLGLLAAIGSTMINVGRSVGYPIGEVANLHAMHIQGLVFQCGLCAFLSGIVLFAASRINETIERRKGDESPATVEVAASDDPAPDKANSNAKLDFVMGLTAIVIVIVLVIFFSLATRSNNRPATGGEPGALSRELDNGALSDVMNSPLPDSPGNAM